MENRSWRWLKVRILGLLDRPAAYDLAGNPVYATRLQHALFPPRAEADRAQR